MDLFSSGRRALRRSPLRFSRSRFALSRHRHSRWKEKAARSWDKLLSPQHEYEPGFPIINEPDVKDHNGRF